MEKENAALCTKLDSLQKALADISRRQDSLQAALMLARDGASPLPALVPPDDDFAISDSLFSLWYSRSETAYSPIEVPSLEITDGPLRSNVPDEVMIARLNAINSAVPLTFNATVRDYCIKYSEKMPAAMSLVMGRAQYYWPIADEVFSYYGIPLEIKALAIVESMLKCDATSRVGAKGLWQFMYRTALGYGMRMNSWIDERMDPMKSTVAAARYLRDAYAVFGDWNLAIASYNCGLGSVRKAIARSGGSRDFWVIYDFLPRETRSYVPAFIGALYAMNYYEEYGIRPAADIIPLAVDTLQIRRNLHFEQIRSATGVDVQTIRELNPQYLNDILPGDSFPCTLRLPLEKESALIAAGDSVYRYRADSLLNPVVLKSIQDGARANGGRIIYKVRSGDVLGRIAARYGCSVKQLKKWNSLRSDNIYIGQKLVIYPRR